MSPYIEAFRSFHHVVPLLLVKAFRPREPLEERASAVSDLPKMAHFAIQREFEMYIGDVDLEM